MYLYVLDCKLNQLQCKIPVEWNNVPPKVNPQQGLRYECSRTLPLIAEIRKIRIKYSRSSPEQKYEADYYHSLL